MNLIDLKERIAISDAFTTEERDFLLHTINAMPETEDVYLIWSNEHRAWWGPGSHGYVPGLSGAGRYSREQTLAICQRALGTAVHIGMLAELPVRLDDVLAFLQGSLVPKSVL